MQANTDIEGVLFLPFKRAARNLMYGWLNWRVFVFTPPIFTFQFPEMFVD